MSWAGVHRLFQLFCHSVPGLQLHDGFAPLQQPRLLKGPGVAEGSASNSPRALGASLPHSTGLMGNLWAAIISVWCFTFCLLCIFHGSGDKMNSGDRHRGAFRQTSLKVPCA